MFSIVRGCSFTGTGKTYTMLGTDDEPGIMARALNDLFHEIQKTSSDMAYKVTMSYLEVRLLIKVFMIEKFHIYANDSDITKRMSVTMCMTTLLYIYICVVSTCL